jgi:competence protein ComEA
MIRSTLQWAARLGLVATLLFSGVALGKDSPSAMININTASVEQLESLDGVGTKKAEAIVAWRKEHGGFKHPDELVEVKGIGAAILAKNKGKIAIK